MTHHNISELFNQFIRADDDLSKAVEDEIGMELLYMMIKYHLNCVCP